MIGHTSHPDTGAAACLQQTFCLGGRYDRDLGHVLHGFGELADDHVADVWASGVRVGPLDRVPSQLSELAQLHAMRCQKLEGAVTVPHKPLHQLRPAAPPARHQRVVNEQLNLVPRSFCQGVNPAARLGAVAPKLWLLLEQHHFHVVPGLLCDLQRRRKSCESTTYHHHLWHCCSLDLRQAMLVQKKRDSEKGDDARSSPRHRELCPRAPRRESLAARHIDRRAA
mmetsp:Transcript_35904/g.93273  ORF Transcript_35904/g.93273 Transcript_35904/m.93273 type:complete len:225 (+) Transcript_35904:968-1642(+)